MSLRAWTCHGSSQHELVRHLCQADIIKNPFVKAVMEQVDRKYFVGRNPYQDAPQPIGQGQTISAPHMHAHVLEELLPALLRKKEKTDHTQAPLNILDVGCGSGYLTACFGEWLNAQNSPQVYLGRSGKVYGIDVKLIEQCRENIRASNSNLLSGGVVGVSYNDGWKGLVAPGEPSAAAAAAAGNLSQQKVSIPIRFDAIHVGAAADEIPRALMEQLEVGGIMIVPIGPDGGTQILYKIERLLESEGHLKEGDFRIQELLAVRYVPLIHP